MDAAVHASDFEEAKRCRDMISLMRSGVTAAEAERADLSGMERQQPGAMGLGTSRQRATPHRIGSRLPSRSHDHGHTLTCRASQVMATNARDATLRYSPPARLDRPFARVKLPAP
ncbi:hypothetical protein SBA_ch1_09970 [Sphingomonas bisphenolicum]|uniref:UVR domain-containing protein n=2 Tax=Sphingomonas bisphenolicum TaxID=296544 RepID=A0ABM7G0M3_9SPHN|nr:hypothetical protein SBA_ch1_09970 [Sphingomonas bisphenolicum]